MKCPTCGTVVRMMAERPFCSQLCRTGELALAGIPIVLRDDQARGTWALVDPTASGATP